MSNTITGKLIAIKETESFGQNGFTKRELAIETNDQYPQKVGLELIKDKCSLIDGYNLGDSVKISYNIRGNEYNSKYYVSLQAWRIEKAEETTPPPADLGKVQESNEDLPF